MTRSEDSLRRVTLEDVAKRAHVWRALVSIVMRDATGASTATRARVWAAARELGYRPDVRARSLASQKSRMIGVMFGVRNHMARSAPGIGMGSISSPPENSGPDGSNVVSSSGVWQPTQFAT